MVASCGEKSVPDFLKAFGLARLGALAGVTAALIGFFFYLTTEILRPPMALLYSGLDPRDSAEIAASLDALKVEYELKGDGSTILVPQDRALRLRMDLASESLPSGGTVGYEIFDSQDALGATNFLQNLNQLRALEGELSRTIRALDAVDQARVHLVIPKRELFARDKAEPSASIVIRPRGSLARAQVQAIQNLVAAAVEGLSPSRVSVIDDKGQLLGGSMASDEAGSMASVEDRTTSLETRLRAEIEQIVSSIVGPGKARVQVAAELDLNRMTRESVTYDPDGQVARSTSTSQTTSQSQDRVSDGTVTATNSLPADQAAAGGQNGQVVDTKNQSTETVNYEVSTEKLTEIIEGGGVKRLSVAVVVDGAYVTAADGTRTYQPRTNEEIDQITRLVRSGIGFDEKRGDRIEVVNMRFAEMEAEVLPEVEEPFFGLTKDDIIRIAEMLILAIISILLIFLIFRPMMLRLLAPPTPGLPALPGASGSTAMVQAGAAGTPGVLAMQQMAGQPGMQQALPSPGISDTSAMIDIARVEGQVKESSIKKVGEIVSNHPDEAMAIMRSWLHEAT
ncbi:MAG: flagellar M-ring protein FliF [Alphaproteobacteria bacterium]|nr:flagellar M-ring protein FliF [Alphaproteobacteria bacterium]